MAERIRMALDLGCRWIVTETGEAMPGEPNHSYNNMLLGPVRANRSLL